MEKNKAHWIWMPHGGHFILASRCSFRLNTYVNGYMKTNPNSTRNDNYSTQGNYNPYTGQEGTKPRDDGYGTSYGNGTSKKSKYDY